MKKNLLKKLMLLLLALVVGTGTSWATDTYTSVLTLDCASPAPTSSFSTLSETSDVATFLNSAAGLTNAQNKISCSAKAGDVYSGKGTGGDGIPQQCLKVGKASGGGSFTFSIPDTYDLIDQVIITGYGWKTSSTISVNSLDGKSPKTAATETTFSFDLTTSSRSISVAVTSSAVCITSIELKAKVETPAGTTASPSISGNIVFLDNTTVTITNDDSADGADIFYTLNGDDPTTTTSATCFASVLPLRFLQLRLLRLSRRNPQTTTQVLLLMRLSPR